LSTVLVAIAPEFAILRTLRAEYHAGDAHKLAAVFQSSIIPQPANTS
jgi:hypothetical protein